MSEQSSGATERSDEDLPSCDDHSAYSDGCIYCFGAFYEAEVES